VFDGDTPGDARRAARERSRIVLTNPDMLHAGILPSHARWAAFFRGLRFVVLDELHTYRGVFGSHMAHVIARLRRIARFHGSNPVFIAATATIGNPREHAARLFGETPATVTLVDRSGAPRAAREVYLYNPPVVNAELGAQEHVKESVALAADPLRARVPTILFGPSRNSVESLKYLREAVSSCHGRDHGLPGYLPDMRRRVEAGLRSGEILCVVATNALELGIDIGDVDAVVCAGYPGSVAGTWQRFGRAGRRGAKSVAVLVCSSDPLDQYLAREPGFLLDAPAEEARVDPSNTEILIQHLKCAAFEAPFELSSAGARAASPAPASGESYLGLDVASTRDALDYLEGHGLVHRAGDRYFWSGEAFPATNVSLRSVWDNFVIIDSAPASHWRNSIAPPTRCCTSKRSTSTMPSNTRWSASISKTTRHTSRRSSPTTSRRRSPTAPSPSSKSGHSARSVVAASASDVKVIEKVTGYKKSSSSPTRTLARRRASAGDANAHDELSSCPACSSVQGAARVRGRRFARSRDRARNGVRPRADVRPA
jgi:DEAD/DEAH box helicase domain-containing protein